MGAGAEETIPMNGLLEFLGNRSLPVAKKGYDQQATDDLLGRLEAGIRQALGQHAEALTRVGELERRIAEGQEREEAVTEALVVATQIRADSEREGKEIQARYLGEAETITAQAKEKADTILRDAETQASRMLDDERLKLRGFEQEIRDAGQLALQARARLTGFLESLLREIERRSPDLGSPVDDLIARAGEVADGDRERHDGPLVPLAEEWDRPDSSGDSDSAAGNGPS